MNAWESYTVKELELLKDYHRGFIDYLREKYAQLVQEMDKPKDLVRQIEEELGKRLEISNKIPAGRVTHLLMEKIEVGGEAFCGIRERGQFTRLAALVTCPDCKYLLRKSL